MKKSKMITVLLLIVILLVALSSLFIACDPKDEPVDSGDVTPGIPPIIIGPDTNKPSTGNTYDRKGAVEKIFGAFIEAPDDMLSLDLEIEIVNSDGSKTTAALRGNMYSEYRNEIAFIISKQLADSQEKETLFGIYMINDKMFVDLGDDKAMLYLEDINPNYVISIINGGVNKLPDLLGDIDLGGLISGFLPPILNALMTAPSVATLEDGGESISMTLTLQSFLSDIPGLLDLVASGLNLPVDLLILIEYFQSILLPDGSYVLRADFDANEDITYLGVNVKNAEQNTNTDISVSLNLSNEAVETGIPEIDENKLANFSLTNIQFAIDITLGTNENGQLDVGDVVNKLLGAGGMGILPKDFALPEELLLVEGGTGIRLAFALDLDLNYHKDPVDRNKIAIELYLLDQNGNIADGEGSRPQIGVYYSEGSLYVNLDNILPNYLQNINVRVDADISVLVSAVVEMITKAIDGALGTDFDKILNMGATVNNDGTVSIPSQAGVEQLLALTNADVLALSSGDSGEFVISVGWVDFINALSNLVQFGDCITVDGSKIVISVDQYFLEALCKLIGKKVEDLGFSFNSVFPGVTININLFKGGLESVSIDTTIDSVLDFEIKIHDFLIGYEDKELDERIANGIKATSTSYANSLSEVFDAALGGIILQTNFTMTFDKGKYNLAPFIASFGLPEIADIDIIWEFDQPFVMDLMIDMQIALDRNNPSESTFVLEIRTGKDGKGIPIANIGPDTVLIGIYGYRNSIYIDLSNFKIMNITLPKLSFDLNFSSLIFNILDDLTAKLLTSMNIEGGDLIFNFDLADLLGLNPSQSTENATLATAAARDTSSSSNQELSALVLLITADKIQPIVSMASILAVINMIDGSLISGDLAEALGMMEIKVDMSMGRKEGFKFEFSGNLIPMVDDQGLSVYYYKDGVQLAPFDEDGNRIFYAKEDYDKKVYNYGEEFVLNFEMGTEAYPVRIGQIPADKKYDFASKAAQFTSYRSDLIQAIMDTVGTGSFELDLTLFTKDNQMDLQAMINTILASVGQRLDIPVNLNLDEWETNVKLLLQWNLDLTSSARTAVKLELQYMGKTLIGVYIYRNSLIIDLEGLGLFSAELINSSIVNNVFNILSDFVNNIDDINLNEIISDLLEKAGLPTLPSAGADGSSDIATDDSLPTIGENVEIMDLVKFILQAVGLHNTSIALNFSSTLINTLLNELLGINLGIDFTLDGRLDLFGNEFDLDLGVEDITVHASLQLNIGGEVNINLSPELIPDWDASSGRQLARTMLDNLDIGLIIDLANDTADANAVHGRAGYTRIRIWKSTGSGDDRLEGTEDNALVPKGNLIVGVYSLDEKRFNNTREGSRTPIAYVVLDYTAESNQMKISLCKNVISILGVVDIGTYAKDIGVNLDLLGSLGGLFENLFKTLEGAFSSMNSTQTDTQEIALADDEDEDLLGDAIGGLDIIKLLSGGINVNLRSNGNFNVDVEFDPYTINKLIDDVLSCVFAGGTGHGSILNLAKMASDMFDTDYLSYVEWTRMEASTFWNSLKTQLDPILKAVISNFAGDFVAWLASSQFNNIYNQLEPIVRSLLPFAVFNEFHVGLNVIDGTFANVYVIGEDHNVPICDETGKEVYGKGSARKQGYSTEIWIYNMFDAVGNPDNSVGGVYGVVTWGDIPSRIEYNPYAYTSDEAGLNNLISTHFSDKTASYQNGSDGAIIKSQVSFALKEFTPDNGAKTTFDDGTSVQSMDLSKKGIYIVQAKAVFGTIERTMNITITSLGMGGGVKEMQAFSMHVYDGLPDFLTMVMEDNTTRKISTNNVTITGYAPNGIKAETVTATVTFPRGVTKEVKINYLDSSVYQVIVNGEVIDIEDGIPNLIVDLYDYKLTESSSLEDYVSDIFYFKYKDGKGAGLTVNEAWTVTSGEVKFYDRFAEIANNPENGLITNVGGEAFVVKSSIGSGATMQEVQLRVWIRTKEVNHLIINGLQDTLRIDPYAYYLYKLYETYGYEEYKLYESYNPFPSSASAYYWEQYGDVIDDYDGVPEEVFITWDSADYEKIDYSWATDNTYKDGNDLTVYLDNSKYEGNFTWDFETQLIVLRNEIQAVYFDENYTQSTLYIDPFDYLLNDGYEHPENVYPQFAYIEFTNGRVLYMPIEWLGLENFEIKDYSSRMTQLQIRIGGGAAAMGVKGNLEQTAYVNVKVNNLVPAGLDIAGSEYNEGTVYYVDPMQVLFYGMNPFPNDVTMVYTDGTRNTLHNVEYEFDTEITMYGATGTLTYKPSTDPRYWYTVKVEIIDRSDMFDSSIKSLDIDPYKYTTDADGSRVYSGFTSSSYIYQQVATVDYSDFDNLTVVGLKKFSGTSSSDYKTYYEYAVTYTKNGEPFTNTYSDLEFLQLFFEDEAENIENGVTVIQSAVVNEYFEVDVEWDLTEINYAIYDNYTVKMIAKAVGGASYDKTFKVTATVIAKKVASVGGENYYVSISYGGKGLTEEELLTKTLTRNLFVRFSDGTTGTYECTIDLSLINFENYNIYTLSNPVVKEVDGVMVTYKYSTKAGEYVADEDVASKGTTVKVTVCSGDIAQVVEIQVVVIYDAQTYMVSQAA
ncbi:MAG: hypothetical protein K2G37_01070 [Clostridia bacterium]|nr:hypothetical protein [Clostridia bacterium]MDE7328545.1 hypothetical protein [Clostridia bacterium]